MKVAAFRWRRAILELALLCVALYAIGMGLRTLTSSNLYRQRITVDSNAGIAFELIGANPSNFLNDDIEFLADNAYFVSDIYQPPAVIRLREHVAPSLDANKFSTIWDALWYLDFIGDRRALHDGLKYVVKTKALAESSRCIDTRKCIVEESTANISVEQGAKLFSFVDEAYLKPAVSSAKSLSYEESANYATDALSIAQISDMEENTSLADYNRALVLGSFLTSQEFLNGKITAEEIDQLDTVSIGGTIGDPAQINNHLVLQYLSGLNLLRNGCYVEAADRFQGNIDQIQHPPIAELFIFLSFRALSRPFINIGDLTLAGEVGPQLIVQNCGTRIQASTFVNRFNTDIERFRRQFVRHPGLVTDIIFYSQQVPTDTIVRERLIARVKAHGELSGRNDNRTDAGQTAGPVMGSFEEDSFEREDAAKITLDAPQDVTLAVDAGSRNTVSSEDEARVVVPPASDIAHFRWPVQGRVVQRFDEEMGAHGNEGISFSVPRGTPVTAAENGLVIYAGDGLKEFGNTVLLKHDDDFVTVYGHAESISVEPGAKVRRGQEIAKSGMSGDTDIPVLYFQVRKNSEPVNPLEYLK